ncbi:hypothetical protein F7725_000697 [Dissostichus mawsoni]|uniref:Uncharacterized protein n=1 Tax=Dissostichus mawsoni TaxID=36200 RepID=A0A7J5ZF60_DISMA|nr:hypothetical protein F7725_000697 [Dissostichus mawsoni]
MLLAFSLHLHLTWRTNAHTGAVVHHKMCYKEEEKKPVRIQACNIRKMPQISDETKEEGFENSLRAQLYVDDKHKVGVAFKLPQAVGAVLGIVKEDREGKASLVKAVSSDDPKLA